MELRQFKGSGIRSVYVLVGEATRLIELGRSRAAPNYQLSRLWLTHNVCRNVLKKTSGLFFNLRCVLF